MASKCHPNRHGCALWQSCVNLKDWMAGKRALLYVFNLCNLVNFIIIYDTKCFYQTKCHLVGVCIYINEQYSGLASDELKQ